MPAYVENWDCPRVCIPLAQPLTVFNECRSMKIQLAGFGLESLGGVSYTQAPLWGQAAAAPRRGLPESSPGPIFALPRPSLPPLQVPMATLCECTICTRLLLWPVAEELQLKTESCSPQGCLLNIPHPWSCAYNLLSMSWEYRDKCCPEYPYDYMLLAINSHSH